MAGSLHSEKAQAREAARGIAHVAWKVCLCLSSVMSTESTRSHRLLGKLTNRVIFLTTKHFRHPPSSVLYYNALLVLCSGALGKQLVQCLEFVRVAARQQRRVSMLVLLGVEMNGRVERRRELWWR